MKQDLNSTECKKCLIAKEQLPCFDINILNNSRAAMWEN